MMANGVLPLYPVYMVDDDASQTPKLADVARLAGVGNATVSRALNGGKNVSGPAMERVLAAIQKLDYRPNRVAQSLKGAFSGVFGMIVPSIADDFFSHCAEAVEAVVREHGALLVVASSRDNDSIALESVRQLLLHNIDGLILAGSKPPSQAMIQLLQGVRLPVVGIDGPLTGVQCPSVLCQNYEGARLAMKHLLGHGYRTIVSVQVKPDLYTMRERLRGYRQAMMEASLLPVEETIANCEDARAVLSRHVQHAGPIVGVFAGNNLSARYLCEAVHQLGLSIPDEVAVLSFDDFDLADTLTPPMSVVKQPLEEMGRTAARLLFEQARNSDANATSVRSVPVMLAPHLVIRESCGCGSRYSSAKLRSVKVRSQVMMR